MYNRNMDFVLKTEYDFYQKIKDRLVAEGNEGKIVLIQGMTIFGFFDREIDAYEAGVRKFGTKLFMIKQVFKEEPVEVVPQSYAPLQ